MFPHHITAPSTAQITQKLKIQPQNPPPLSTFTIIPDDILIDVFKYLSLMEKGRCSHTRKNFPRLIKESDSDYKSAVDGQLIVNKRTPTNIEDAQFYDEVVKFKLYGIPAALIAIGKELFSLAQVEKFSPDEFDVTFLPFILLLLSKNLITVELLKELGPINCKFLFYTINKNLLFSLENGLVTTNELATYHTSITTTAFSSSQGIYALQKGLISKNQIADVKNTPLLQDLLTDNCIALLEAKRVTIEEVEQMNPVDRLDIIDSKFNLMRLSSL